MDALNLEKQLTFYGSYHHNPVNVWIHIICVPIILMTSLQLLTNTPSIPLPSWLTIPNLPLHAGTVVAFLYSLLYLLMEPIAGALIAPLIIGGTAAANHLTSAQGASINYISAGFMATAWVLQFVGHGKFEDRAPALLDNLVQAFFLAPFFVFLEVLFMMGYRPELKARLEKDVETELKRLNDRKKSADAASKGKGKEL